MENVPCRVCPLWHRNTCFSLFPGHSFWKLCISFQEQEWFSMGTHHTASPTPARAAAVCTGSRAALLPPASSNLRMCKMGRKNQNKIYPLWFNPSPCFQGQQSGITRYCSTRASCCYRSPDPCLPSYTVWRKSHQTQSTTVLAGNWDGICKQSRMCYWNNSPLLTLGTLNPIAEAVPECQNLRMAGERRLYRVTIKSFWSSQLLSKQSFLKALC